MKPQELEGMVIYESDRYQVRVTEQADGLHVYSIRKAPDGKVYRPRAYLLGYNALYHEVLKRKAS
jgi:hypothetical protein